MVQSLAKNWWALVLRGLAGVLFGLAAFFWPAVTLVVLVVLFGAYSLVDGVFNLVAAVSRSDQDRWWGLLLSGILGILVGVWTFFWPGVTAIALLYLIAAWAVVHGVFD